MQLAKDTPRLRVNFLAYGFPKEDLEELRKKVDLDMRRNAGGPMIFSVAEMAVVRLLS